MAQGALHAADADIALSVSGIAGPDGAARRNRSAPYGSFCERSGRVLACERRFSGDRDAVRLQATVFALQTVLDEFL
ncbi:Uncharacterized protein (competence- and mitomycin-induced) [Serratia rubidaea]|uniref:Uncharacterized protein (Competence- and mitomycin-induced) n=1 Tax=Serratia rubidaea TaxID=61652 RepID=A0A4U9HBZ9_SERRU|nr:Uncharacterized protein (competence- and mitomycin-induced) [Serratia rubidaea]